MAGLTLAAANEKALTMLGRDSRSLTEPLLTRQINALRQLGKEGYSAAISYTAIVNDWDGR